MTSPPSSLRLLIYKNLLRSTLIKEALGSSFFSPSFPCEQGEEGIATVICSGLEATDLTFCTFPSLDHYLAKGATLSQTLFTSSLSTLSLHAPLFSFSASSQLEREPTFQAFASQLQKGCYEEGRLTVLFFQEKDFFQPHIEGLFQQATLHRAPVLFVGTSSSKKIWELSKCAFHFSAHQLDEILQKGSQAIEKTRAGMGPSLFLIHKGAHTLSPLQIWEELLLDQGVLTPLTRAHFYDELDERISSDLKTLVTS